MPTNNKQGDAPIIDVTEGNKKIALFMGGEINKNFTTIIDFKTSPTNYSGSCMSFDDLKYHTSWDWLIPAWSKFLMSDNKLDPYETYLFQVTIGGCIATNDCQKAFALLVTNIKRQTNQQ